MRIETKKSFDKMFEKLDKRDKERIASALWIFIENPFDVRLKNHELKWEFSWIRSINAGFDLRILYQELSNGRHELVALVKVWSHSELYG